MIKFYRRRLISRRQALKIGIGTIATFATISLGNLKALSYLTYALTETQKTPDVNGKRNFRVVGKSALKKRAKAKGIIYGSFPEVYHPEFDRDRQLQSHFIQECAMMTVGCYWERTRPSIETFDFSGTDYFVKFASKHKMRLRGHPLVWHDSLPKWLPGVLNRDNAERILAHHIQTIVKRYAGQMHSWDVVNEAIDVGEYRADGAAGAYGFRKSPWLEFLGVDYIDLAFRLAARSDPRAKLVYNDFGVEYDRPNDEAKRQAVLNLLQRLKSKKTPIYSAI
jgi:endo-1,4-beta-xylanase